MRDQAKGFYLPEEAFRCLDIWLLAAGYRQLTDTITLKALALGLRDIGYLAGDTNQVQQAIALTTWPRSFPVSEAADYTAKMICFFAPENSDSVTRARAWLAAMHTPNMHRGLLRRNGVVIIDR